MMRATMILLLALLLSAMPPALAQAETAGGGDAVGAVTFVIGDSHIVAAAGAAGAAVALVRGTRLTVGQTLETGANGHVFIRFVDGEAVAVRPDTRFRIDEYRFDPAHPAASRIRFTLEKGVVRAITGRAGAAAPDTFRLNTPIAAIGVKGTDFVTQSVGADTTRVSVVSGTIVLAPLGQGCAAAALGPCGGHAARELSADMGRYIEYSTRSPLPQFIQIESGSPLDQAAPPRPEERKLAPVSHHGDGDPQFAPVLTDTNAASALTVQTDWPAAGPQTFPAGAQLVPQIWWGRWAAFVDPSAPASVAFAALMAPDRELGGGNDVLGLLRLKAPDLQLPAGQVAFSLAVAEAYLRQGNQLLPALVNGGTLGIDFDARSFATALSIAAPGLQTATYAAQGYLQGDGRFYQAQPATGMRVFGSVSAAAAQAGYAFTQPLGGQRSLVGATLWTR